MNELLERVELKIAFLERANNELSDVVYRQQRDIDGLRAQIEGLKSQLDTLKSVDPTYTADEERPPHY
jgi:SlyX protein